MQNIYRIEVLMRVEWVWRFSARKSAVEGFDAVNG